MEDEKYTIIIKYGIKSFQTCKYLRTDATDNPRTKPAVPPTSDKNSPLKL